MSNIYHYLLLKMFQIIQREKWRSLLVRKRRKSPIVAFQKLVHLRVQPQLSFSIELSFLIHFHVIHDVTLNYVTVSHKLKSLCAPCHRPNKTVSCPGLRYLRRSWRQEKSAAPSSWIGSRQSLGCSEWQDGCLCRMTGQRTVRLPRMMQRLASVDKKKERLFGYWAAVREPRP